MQQHGKFKLQIINAGAHKLNTVKAVKGITGWDLLQSKNAVVNVTDSIPSVISYADTVEELTEAADRLREVGASVEIMPTYTNEHIGI